MWDSNQLPQTSYNQSQSAYNKDSVVDSNSSDFHSRKLSLDLDPEPEPDYFQDMAPEVKRSKKVTCILYIYVCVQNYLVEKHIK